MFGIGLPEMILILALALIVVGPDKLPELARLLQKGVLELKKTVSTLKENLEEENPFDSVKPELEDVSKSIKEKLMDPAADEWKGILPDEGVNPSATVDVVDDKDIIEGQIINDADSETDTEVAVSTDDNIHDAVSSEQDGLPNNETDEKPTNSA